jgi:tRNA (mo5U34)-methyltransferase
MARIFISYGITKSASTFAWQLIKRTAIAGGLPVATLTAGSKGIDSPEDYIDPVSDENLRKIEADVGNAPVVIKTHGGVTPAVVRLLAEGTAQVFASYRDPRDVALSLLDHGARSREIGIKDFAEFHEVKDTIETIKIQIQKFENWVRTCEPLLIPYDEICFDTRRTIARVAERVGVSVDVDRVFAEFNSNKNLIGQFNKGDSRRFEREIDRETSLYFLEIFNEYYNKFFPEEINEQKTFPAGDSTMLVARDPRMEADMLGRPKSGSGAATKEDVIWCYRSLLGRDPESTEVVDRQAALSPDFRALVLRFVSSQEFLRKKGFARAALDGPAMRVELTVSAHELRELRDRIGRAWAQMGATKPHWSVLTGTEYLPQNINHLSIDRFYESGITEARTIGAILNRHDFHNIASKTCVEYGCGLGRVTLALAGMFKSVKGYDISATHLKLAEERKAAQKIDNAKFILSKDVNEKVSSCDFFYSRLVFQHNPPPLILQLIASALGSLREGGVAIFQVSTYGPDYSFHVQKYIAKEWQPRLELHCVPQSEVFRAISAAECEVLEVREDSSLGRPTWVSNVFVVKRPNRSTEPKGTPERIGGPAVTLPDELKPVSLSTASPTSGLPPEVTALTSQQKDEIGALRNESDGESAATPQSVESAIITGPLATSLPRAETAKQLDGVLLDRVEKVRWFHQIDLGPMVTPGVKPAVNAAFQASVALKDVAGKTVLDIGAWDGYFSFAAERAGASRVMAIDHFCWVGPGWGKIDGFLTAREILNSSVEYKIMDAAEVSRETVGTFDVVLFLGVFYHLKDPFTILERISSCATERLVIETETAVNDLPFPASRFFPRAELNNDQTNWWAPNRPCVEGMLRGCGFRRIEWVAAPWVRQTAERGRGIFVAHRNS